MILFAAFLIGILSGYVENSSCVWILFGVLCTFDVLSLVGDFYSKFLMPQDKILLLMPVLFLLGFVGMDSRTQTYPVEEVFEERVECLIRGTVVSIDSSGTYLRLGVNKVCIVIGEETYECDRVLISSDVEDEFHIGNQVECYGKLMKFEPPGNPGQFDEAAYYKMKGYDYKFKAESVVVLDRTASWFWDVTSKLKLRMLKSYEAILSEEDYGLVVAMLLGETAYMDEELQSLYQKNGISHLLAISGLHITLLGMGFYHMLRKLRVGTVVATLSSIGFLLYYGLFTGFSVSTNRAVVMMILSLSSGVIGKTYDVKCAMTVSAFLILIQNPLQLFSAGFLLSYGAIVGIVIVNGILIKALQVKNKILQPLLMSASVQIVTLPLILFLFYEFPLYSVLLNLLVLPLSSILVGLPLIAGIVGCLSASMGGFLIGGVHYILWFIELLCRFFAGLPGCTQTWGKPEWYDLIFYYLGLTLIMCCAHYLIRVRKAVFESHEEEKITAEEILQLEERNQELERLQRGKWLQTTESLEGELQNGVLVIDKSKEIPEVQRQIEREGIYLPKESHLRLFILRCCIKKSAYAILCLAMLGLMLFFLPERTKGLEITLLDVGQGDGIYIESESGANYLIDGGSSQVNQLANYRILPFLKSKGRTSLDTVIVTHSDSDHTSGVIELISGGFPIRRLILPDVSTKDEAYEALVTLAKEAEIPLYYIKRGDTIVDGDLLITCLHPEPTFLPESINSYSTVLSLSYGEFQMLLTGDIEGNGEEAVYGLLKELGDEADYDVLKVAHHGSKNSTTLELLKLIRPEYSLISVGKNNWYGHPSPLLLERLEEVGSNIATTKEWGAICLKTDGHQLWIQGYKEK